jgi:ABC-2 type transport system ATP-binding protein
MTPKFFFLDEPTANLDPEAAKTVRDFILELKKEKRTFFLNTHNLDEAQRICDRVGIIKTKMIQVGTMEQLREALSGRKTIIHVDKLSDKIVVAVKKLKFKSVRIENNDTLIIDVDNPDEDNPNIVNAIVAAGGRVQSISGINPTLEDIYLKLVRS